MGRKKVPHSPLWTVCVLLCTGGGAGAATTAAARWYQKSNFLSRGGRSRLADARRLTEMTFPPSGEREGVSALPSAKREEF